MIDITSVIGLRVIRIESAGTSDQSLEIGTEMKKEGPDHMKNVATDLQTTIGVTRTAVITIVDEKIAETCLIRSPRIEGFLPGTMITTKLSILNLCLSPQERSIYATF